MLLSGGYFDSVSKIINFFKRETRKERKEKKDPSPHREQKLPSDSDKYEQRTEQVQREDDTRKVQIIFVGATLPKEETNNKSLYNYLKKYFPSIRYAQSQYLHHPLHNVKHQFLPLPSNIDDCFDMLAEVIRKRTELINANQMNDTEGSIVEKRRQTLIFVNSSFAVDQVDEELKMRGIKECVPFHR